MIRALVYTFLALILIAILTPYIIVIWELVHD